MFQDDSGLTVKSLTASNTTRFQGRPLLFFLRRVPKFGQSRRWVPPTDTAVYEQALDNEGFIVPSILKENEVMTQALTVDLRELEQHLMPHFWRANREAKYYQNKYYQYQWSFTISVFLTTVCAAWNVVLRAQGWEGASVLGLIKTTQLLGWLMVINSAMAAVVSFLQANEAPHRNWFKARAEAESLRSLYFLFLARQTPFDLANTGERVEALRHKVVDVLKGTRRDEPNQKPSPTLFPFKDELTDSAASKPEDEQEQNNP